MGMGKQHGLRQREHRQRSGDIWKPDDFSAMAASGAIRGLILIYSATLFQSLAKPKFLENRWKVAGQFPSYEGPKELFQRIGLGKRLRAAGREPNLGFEAMNVKASRSTRSRSQKITFALRQSWPSAKAHETWMSPSRSST